MTTPAIDHVLLTVKPEDLDMAFFITATEGGRIERIINRQYLRIPGTMPMAGVHMAFRTAKIEILEETPVICYFRQSES